MKKFIDNLIERLTSSRESEIIIGDMTEEYNFELKSNGKFRADATYAFNFFTLLTNKVLKRPQQNRSNFFTMFTNYLKVALRQLGRQMLHNTINITGLAIGLAVTFVITLYVMNEFSFDQFHAKKDRIYLVPMTWKFRETQLPTAFTTAGAGPIMKELFSKEIETYVRVQFTGVVFDGPQGPIGEGGIAACDSTFFDVFTFPLLIGNPHDALKQPYSIVLTEKAAVRYFGEDWKEKDVLAQTLVAQGGKIYKITGVAKDPPFESHIRFDVLMSITSLPKKEWEPNWDKASMTTYVVLDPNASAAQIVSDLPKRVAATYGQEQNDHVELDLIPLTDVYLRNQKYSGMWVSDIRYVYIFSAIAALVLIIAIINYMNLSTARSLERAKEVGVRKVVGALRVELFWQFISESILVTFAAIVAAVGVAYLLLPLFNTMAEKTLAMDFGRQPEWILVLITMWLLISFLGGAYPAMMLSSFRPAKVLKGKFGSAGGGAFLRKSLVAFQFGVSILLIVCTLTINSQLSFMVNKKVGVDKELLVGVPLDSLARANVEVIRNEFLGIVGVERSAQASSSPVTTGAKTTVFGGDIGEKQVLIFNLGADGSVVRTIGLDVLTGTDFSPEVPKDGTWEFLINESAVKFFGWTNETAIGKRLNLWQEEGVIKGVVRDFHFLPLQRPIEPLLIHHGKGNAGGFLNKLLVRIDNENYEGITAAMEQRWKKVVPGSPMSTFFMEDHYNNQYRSERRLSSIMNVFSALAILIAGLGLFGLASYTIMLRTKELGIRKVLGASLSRLLVTVSANFITLVVIAFVVAAPLSWYAMTNWLANFAYPVGFDWLIVIVAGISAVVVAAGTVLYHAMEAAMMNPARTLRNE